MEETLNSVLKSLKYSLDKHKASGAGSKGHSGVSELGSSILSEAREYQKVLEKVSKNMKMGINPQLTKGSRLIVRQS